jgi:hypothetical protein
MRWRWFDGQFCSIFEQKPLKNHSEAGLGYDNAVIVG